MKINMAISKPTAEDPESGTKTGLLRERVMEPEKTSYILKWALLAVVVGLIVITTVALVTLIVFKINQLDSQFEIMGDILATEVQMKKTRASQKKSMDQELIDPDDSGIWPEDPEPGQSISLSREIAGSPTYIVKNWLFDDWVNNNPDYDVIDNAYITINTEGIYTIQAQVSFRMKIGMATYQIKKRTVDEMAGKALSQCVTTFDKTYAQQKSCFTSTTSYLKPGDQIYVDIFKDNLTVDFRDGKSTFGVIKMQDLTLAGKS